MNSIKARFVISLFLLWGSIFIYPRGAYAASYSPGDACSSSGAFHQINDASGMDFLICDGSLWRSTLYFGSAGGLTISKLSGQPAPLYSSSGGGGGGGLWTAGSGDDIYYNTGTARVGIGTTSPDAPLHVGDAAITSEGGTHEFILSETGSDQPNILFIDGGNNESSVGLTNDSYFAIASENSLSGIQFRVNGDYTTDMLNTAGAAMTIATSGNVGIGDTNPSVALDVVGDINYTGVITDVSDRRKKENITPLQNSLDGVLALNGYSFTMKDAPDKEVEYGLIAQEVEPVFPELVKTQSDGLKTMNYVGLIAPLVEAVKAQNAEIEALRDEIEQLKARLPDNAGEAK